MDDPDFEKLRADRDEAVSKIATDMAKDMARRAGKPEAEIESVHINYGGGTSECYCACADGGPCEHDFSGWREFDDGNGGEQYCQRCGMGAMAHTMWTCWD